MGAATETVRASWACPGARTVLRADAPRDRWLLERRAGIGGSDASILAGVNRWSSPYTVWLDKIGQAPGKQATMPMRLGSLMEPILLRLFVEQTRIAVRRAGLMRSKACPWMQVTVDGLTADGGLLELKRVGWRMAEEWADGQVSDHAEIQVQHAMAVTGRSHAWVFALVDDEPALRRLDRDENLIENLIGLEHRFWHAHVLTRVAPPIAEAAALPAVKARWAQVQSDVRVGERGKVGPLLTAWAAAKTAVKQAEADASVLEARLREEIGDADTLQVDGEPVLTCRASGPFSERRFREQHPDLAARHETTRPALDTARIKTEHPDAYGACRGRVLRAVQPPKGK